jgi:hypothetical protein
VREEIARVDKRAVRRRLMARLRSEVKRRGGVWMNVAAFPHPYRSAVNFRIDYDDLDERDFATTLDAVRGYEDATSHFVCAAEFDGRVDALAHLHGLDVGSHGYWHHTYRDVEDNRRNVSRGIGVLRAAGIEPSGFVAPHGRFNRGLLRVLDELKITHSSEFGLAYDDLPFRPHGSSVLQIPVHPVCLGVILEAAQRGLHASCEGGVALRQAADLAVEYFIAVASAKHAAHEPAFFYCHPTGRLGRFPHVLTDVLRAASELNGMWRITYTQFAAWWRQRADIAFRVTGGSDGYTLHVERESQGLPAAVEFWRPQGVAVLPLDRTVVRLSPEALHYEPRPETPLPADPTPLPGPRTPRAAIRRFLDWEKATPVSEIRVRSMRTLLKKTLRYVKR